LIVEFNWQKQVVVNATGKVRSYDLATGKELWSCGGQTANAIPGLNISLVCSKLGLLRTGMFARRSSCGRDALEQERQEK
jgi:hypothetical protein